MRALEQARAGAVEAALQTLQAAEEALEADALAMVYLLVEDEPEAALGVCDLALGQTLAPATASTWRLRRGRLHGLVGKREAAMRDLLQVIQLQASTEQVQEANRALLKLAGG